MKKCIKCQKIKDENEFYFYKLTNNICKDCKKEYGLDYRKNKGRDKKIKYMKEYNRKLRSTSEGRAKTNKQNRESYQRHKERILKSNKKCRDNNEHREKERLRWRKRRENPKERLKNNISRLINLSLHGEKAGKSWEIMLGYGLKQLKKHLERQFKPGMCWDNYGKDGWVVDHKIPISAFNFSKPKHIDFKRCWALKNLQPMWAKENTRKGAKIVKHFQPCLRLNG